MTMMMMTMKRYSLSNLYKINPFIVQVHGTLQQKSWIEKDCRVTILTKGVEVKIYVPNVHENTQVLKTRQSGTWWKCMVSINW